MVRVGIATSDATLRAWVEAADRADLALEWEIAAADESIPGLVTRLRAQPGRHLVVGHSNTIPVLVRALGGEAGGLIEQEEYDRLYILTLTGSGASTVLLRFGAPQDPR